ncbi:MAG TPA: PP2C family protein-serine/threonine phosphatase, partial [Candidatus Omnitrophota bacterium]|nr:PP2C family protein-serine/threonine phosphatase [Candidatus Omnitrophota bacterium]
MPNNIKIPQSHQLEFFAKQALLAKSRVRLFCILILSLYFTITGGDFLLRPATYRMGEIWTGAILLLGGLSILHLNSKAYHLERVKLNAFIFAVLLHFMLFKLGLVYSEAASVMTTYYILTLFLVILFIPWSPAEASLIGLLNLLTFLLYGVTRLRIFGPSTLYLHLNGFIDGIILIAVSASLCVLIRKMEMGREIHNFILLKEIESKNEQTRKELEFARRIHKTLIPDSISTEKADITVTYLPVDIIGGDYAKFHFYGKDRLIFIICDVTGHGVSAALLVNRVHAKYEELVKDGKEPGSLLKELDAFVAKDFRDTNMYLTAFCGLLDFKKKNFFYSNYGH